MKENFTISNNRPSQEEITLCMVLRTHKLDRVDIQNIYYIFGQCCLSIPLSNNNKPSNFMMIPTGINKKYLQKIE